MRSERNNARAGSAADMRSAFERLRRDTESGHSVARSAVTPSVAAPGIAVPEVPAMGAVGQGRPYGSWPEHDDDRGHRRMGGRRARLRRFRDGLGSGFSLLLHHDDG